MFRAWELLLILFFYFKQKYFRTFSSRDELLRWQEAQMNSHLKYILPLSPYYQNRIKVAGNWRSLAPIQKSEMMENFNVLNTVGIDRDQALALAIRSEETRDFSPMIRNISVGLSSGTSGHRGLFLASFYERCRYMGTILAKVLPAPIWQPQKIAFFLRANSNLYTAAGRGRIQFRFFDLLSTLEDHIRELNAFKPSILIGPPSVLRKLAEASENGKLLIQPAKIISVAEVLDPLDKKILEKTFKQVIHQIYQCTEGFLGHTCKEGNIHLNEDILIFEKEYLDRGSRKFMPILSDFTRISQPILRYRLNDVLTELEEPCKCGSVFTALEFVEGRSDDVLKFRALDSDGSVDIYPDFIRRAVMFASDKIKEYLVIQRGDCLFISLKLNAQGGASPELRQQVEASIGEQIRALAVRLNAREPGLNFNDTFPELGLRKLRRVVHEKS